MRTICVSLILVPDSSRRFAPRTIKNDGWELAPPDWAGFSGSSPRDLECVVKSAS